MELQPVNIVGTVACTSICYYFTNKNGLDEERRRYLLALCIPGLHQLYVAFCWRSELHFKLLTNLFGSTQTAFTLYQIGFAILFGLRMVSTISVAQCTQNTLDLSIVRYLGAAVCTIGPAYLFYSVFRYFGISRAFGMDHFYPERCKQMGMVNQGIYKYVNNAQYKIGLLGLYLPGLYFQSKNALIVALCNHLAIWIHYQCIIVLNRWI
eukprot:666397_1